MYNLKPDELIESGIGKYESAILITIKDGVASVASSLSEKQVDRIIRLKADDNSD